MPEPSGKEKYRSTKRNMEKNNKEDADKYKTYMGNSKTKDKGLADVEIYKYKQRHVSWALTGTERDDC
jgi:hypothetical protein